MLQTHYCKWCEKEFRLKIEELLCGDFFIECPYCYYKHYRHFKDGVAVHCDITKRFNNPEILRATA